MRYNYSNSYFAYRYIARSIGVARGTRSIDRTAVEPTWSRRWNTQGRAYYQGLYALQTATAGQIGVRVTITAQHGYPEYSNVLAEVFDGTQWHAVSGLAGTLMHSFDRQDQELIDADVRTVLSDVSLAYSMRAPGPGIQVSHQPPADEGGLFDIRTDL